MKNLIILLVFALLIGNKVEAQQKSKTQFMIVSIHAGIDAWHPEMVVTNEDGAQKITRAGKNSWMWTGETFDKKDGKLAANEDSLFETLKPFFDAGWKLVSTNIVRNTAASTHNDDYIARYFFTKED